MLLVTFFASLAAPVALAADGEPPATVVAAPTAAQGTADDPNIDRAFLLPTAMTQPAGSATYNNYELLLHGFTYGVTDRVQATLTVLAPIVKDMPFFGIVAGKWQVASLPRLHVAVQGSAGLLQSAPARRRRPWASAPSRACACAPTARRCFRRAPPTSSRWRPATRGR